MHPLALSLSTLLVACATVHAQTATYTLGLYRSDPDSNSAKVVDARGDTYLLFGDPAVAVLRETGVIRVGATREGKRLTATWIEASTRRTTRVGVDGKHVTIPEGATLKLLDKQSTPYRPVGPGALSIAPEEDTGTLVVDYRIELADGSRVWVSEDELSLEFTPISAELASVDFAGRVELDGETPFVDDERRGRLRLLGPLAKLVTPAHEGRFLQGQGILSVANSKLLVRDVRAVAIRPTQVCEVPGASEATAQLETQGEPSTHPTIRKGSPVRILEVDVSEEPTRYVVQLPGGHLARVRATDVEVSLDPQGTGAQRDGLTDKLSPAPTR